MGIKAGFLFSIVLLLVTCTQIPNAPLINDPNFTEAVATDALPTTIIDRGQPDYVQTSDRGDWIALPALDLGRFPDGELEWWRICLAQIQGSDQNPIDALNACAQNRMGTGQSSAPSSSISPETECVVDNGISSFGSYVSGGRCNAACWRSRQRQRSEEAAKAREAAADERNKPESEQDQDLIEAYENLANEAAKAADIAQEAYEAKRNGDPTGGPFGLRQQYDDQMVGVNRARLTINMSRIGASMRNRPSSSGGSRTNEPLPDNTGLGPNDINPSDDPEMPVPSCSGLAVLQNCIEQQQGDLQTCLRKVEDPVSQMTGGRCKTGPGRSGGQEITCIQKDPDAFGIDPTGSPWQALGDWCAQEINPVASTSDQSFSCPTRGGIPISVFDTMQLADVVTEICRRDLPGPHCPGNSGD